MLLAIQIAALIGCLKLLVETERPAMCAGIFAGAMGFLALLAGGPVLAIGISTAISFAWCFGWFWLLVRVADGGIWWAIVAAGILLPVIVRLALAWALAG